jgi:uncharacterized membrane protein SpoIIM required for sporulation
MDLSSFLRERQPRWDRLSQVLDQVDQAGLESLSSEEIHRLFSLYRLVSSDLNLVATRTANPALIEYLESLVGRAYVHLVPRRRYRLFREWWKVVRYRFPRLIRKERNLMGLVTAIFVLSVAFGYLATALVPTTAEIFLPAEHVNVSPSARVASLEALERSGKTRVDTAGKHAEFTTFLFTHNIRVSFLCFSLGLTFGIGTVALLVMNSAMLGSLAALYAADGVLSFFIAWVGPHGAIELPSILFASLGGLMLARAQFRRDRGSFLYQLRQMRGDLIDLLIGTCSLLVIAGIVEGGFSQVNEPTIPYPLKHAVAVILFIALVAYLFWMPVKEKNADVVSHELAVA